MQKAVSRSQTKGSSNHKAKTKAPFFPAAICLLGGLLASLVFSILFGLIYSLVDLPQMAVNVLVLLALLFGAAVCGVLCARAFPKERGLMALICSLSMTILLVLMNLFFFQEPVTGLSFAKYGTVVIGAFLGAAVINPNKSRKGKKKLKKH